MDTNVMQLGQLGQLAVAYGVPIIGRLAGAIALWVIGRWVIGALSRFSGRLMAARHIDPTLIGYLQTSVVVLLTLILAIASLGVLGVETTSFAAILAAAGVAVGMAWSGLLANFAAGIFLVLLRPFRQGDMISAAGTTGEVVDIGLFATTVHTADNLKVIVGNNKIFGDNIVNYSANAFRAVDLRAQVAHGVAPSEAIARLRPHIASIPNVVTSPAPLIEILKYNAAGTLLVVRPFCNNANYWQVYFDTNRAIGDVFGAAKYPIPESRSAVRQLES